jgi:hypothetical protein
MAIQLHNEYAIDRTYHAPMNATRGRGPRLFQVPAKIASLNKRKGLIEGEGSKRSLSRKSD